MTQPEPYPDLAGMPLDVTEIDDMRTWESTTFTKQGLARILVTIDRLAKLAHQGRYGVCLVCDEAWPCSYVQLLDHIGTQAARIEALREAACVVMVADLEECEDDEAIRFWHSLAASLDEDPWSNGRHQGDCTKTAHTCNRCLVEEFRARVSKIVDALLTSPSQHEPVCMCGDSLDAHRNAPLSFNHAPVTCCDSGACASPSQPARDPESRICGEGMWHNFWQRDDGTYRSDTCLGCGASRKTIAPETYAASPSREAQP